MFLNIAHGTEYKNNKQKLTKLKFFQVIYVLIVSHFKNSFFKAILSQIGTFMFYIYEMLLDTAVDSRVPYNANSVNHIYASFIPLNVTLQERAMHT